MILYANGRFADQSRAAASSLRQATGNHLEEAPQTGMIAECRINKPAAAWRMTPG